MKSIIQLAFTIYPQTSGQTIYSLALARWLSEKYRIYLFTYATKNFNKDTDEILNFYEEIHTYKYVEKRDIQSTIDRFRVLHVVDDQMYDDVVSKIESEKISTVVIDHLGMSSFYYRLKRKFPNISFIYSSGNVESLNIDAAFMKGGRNKRLWHIRAYLHKLTERDMLKKADAVISISNSDTDYFRNVMKIHNNYILSKPHYLFKCIREESEFCKPTQTMMIAGSMSWYPNVSGVLKFVNEVFIPMIQGNSEAKLYIVGKNPTEELVALGKSNPNIIVTGFVEDIDEYYKKCDIAIIPVFEGSGIKIKLLEALGKGVPVLSTSHAARGYDICDRIIVEDDSVKMIEYLKRVMSDSNLRKRLHHGSLELYNEITRSENLEELDRFVK